MNQMALDFDPRKLARRRDATTSHEAAAKTRQFAASHEARIFEALHNHPEGLNYREIGGVTGLEAIAVARRLSGMRERGLIVQTPEIRGGMSVWRKA